MAAYLVTGGAGFIGSHLVDRLLELGRAVRVLDDFSTGRRENLVHVRDRVELLEGSVCDLQTCRAACRDVEAVLHQAALPSVPRSMADPLTTHRVNADGTFNMLLAAREAGVRRFVYASSSSVYGETQELPQRETMPLRPVSPYGASKAVGEIYCHSFSCSFGLQTVALRYFNVFGPRQDPTSEYSAAIPRFLSRLLRGQPPVVFGDGEQSRDFIYVGNVVEANLLAVQACLSDGRTCELRGQAVNVAAGRAITLNEVIAVMNELLGTAIKARYDAPRPGDVRHSLADVSAARRLIGFQPRVSFRDGLAMALEWYRKNL